MGDMTSCTQPAESRPEQRAGSTGLENAIALMEDLGQSRGEIAGNWRPLMLCKALLTALFAGLFTTSAAGPAWAYLEDCRPVVEQKLSELRADTATINRISVLIRREPGKSHNRVIGYDATVSFKNYSGYLAIDMNRYCDIEQVYSRNECRFPGVAAY